MTKLHPQGVGCSETSRTPLRAGIVGAGIAGASCAGTLAAAGWDVDVFDKARGAGGRLSTKRTEQGWATLGTPFISAKREPFRSQLRDWVRQGWIAPVRGNIWQGRATISWAEAQMQNHYRPTIQPSQLVRHLLGNAHLHTGSRVVALQPRTLILENGEVRGNYDCVICSVPSPQAIPLLDALPLLRERLGEVRYRPIWSFLMRWEGGPAADVIKFDDHLLNLAVRQTSDGPGLWAVHSSHEFAETYLEASEMEASNRAASALMGLLGLPWPVEIEASHLWRYARPESSAEGFWLGDRENRVALIGDGIAGVGVERAWESGVRLAQALIQSKEELTV
ncbi:MAG: NAD(P)-binding protein [Thiobacillus sp.]|nr:NAD(P)-binding protein [Thiobacillus sp.]